MSKPAKYLLYRVTLKKETRPKEPLFLGLPDLDARKFPRLKKVHPFFRRKLWLTPGRSRIVPLTASQVAQLVRQQRWRIRLFRGHGQPVTDRERELIAICEARHQQLEAARRKLWSFTNPFGDYVRARYVAQRSKTAAIGEDLEHFRAAGIMTEEVAAAMAAVVARISELRADLEGKGWTFPTDGPPSPPSSGGRPSKFPSAAIRAYYRLLSLQHLALGVDGEVIELIQRDLEPFFGGLSREDIQEAIKYQLRDKRFIREMGGWGVLRPGRRVRPSSSRGRRSRRRAACGP